MGIEFEGKIIATDEDGYLEDLSDWSEALATKMAALDDIELSKNHWEVIYILKEYYDAYQVAPAVRILTKTVGKKLGEDKGNSMYLFRLFPGGPAKQACKYAGMPKPTGCI